MNRTLTTLAALACAAPAMSQLQIYTPQNDLFLPFTSDVQWQGQAPVPTEFFDIRLPPEQALTTNIDGTMILLGYPLTTSSTPESAGMAEASPLAPRNIEFLGNGTQTFTAFTCFNNFPWNTTVPASFQPGDSVGPNATPAATLVETPLFVSPTNQCSNQDESADVNVVGDGFTLGVAITEPDGVHYGWVTLERLDPDGPVSIFEGFRIVQYAYQLTPGVPALVPQPCTADANGDGQLTPADFNAWIIAFNNQAPACDQNADGLCTPADFNAWILNYNAGC